jgi:nucleoside-diphosphate-sugar epimerase
VTGLPVAAVTGAAGRLGRVVCGRLSEHGWSVVGLDRVPVPSDVGIRRSVLGSADDVEAVDEALADAEVVVHTAALASPALGTPPEVFRTNTVATFTVLDAAVRHGLRRAVIASSFSILGVPFGWPGVRPPSLPVDETSALDVRDVYGLTKQVDETTAAMIAAATPLTVVALRFPLLGSPEVELSRHAEQNARDPGQGAPMLWAYLDTRDAARAVEAALTADVSGLVVVGVAAPMTLASLPTEDLLERYLPDVPRRRRFAGREVPIDLTAAWTTLGFRAEHPYPVLCQGSGDERTA